MTTNEKALNRQTPSAERRQPGADPVSGFDLMGEWRVVSRPALSGGDRSDLEGLRSACEAAEPLDLKLELEESDAEDRPIHFIALAGRDLIGYVGITAGDEAEVCGMVHPAWRRRGVASRLLGDLRAASQVRGVQSVLVICEDAGPIALEWMRRLGATLESAERRMTVRLDPSPRDGGAGIAFSDQQVELRRANDADREVVAGILSHESHAGDAHSDVLPEESSGERRLVGVADGIVVGTLRIIASPRRTMIYGFVVDPARRGQRIGTRMLATVLDQLRSDGTREVGLEVDPENTPAVRLYERYGFKTVTTYRYMRLASAT